jgi:hypothetical protein
VLTAEDQEAGVTMVPAQIQMGGAGALVAG